MKRHDYSSNRIKVKSEELPDNLKNAFIAIEDERFYEHDGVDFKGILRALWTDLRNGSTSQGASTLTQQLIKNNVFEAGGESNIIAKIKRKIQEQYLAINAEKTKPKEEILTDYLNTINLGKGNLGVETASKYYFGKSAKNLTLSECAVLAGITKNPTYLNPVDYPEANDARRKLILKKMYQLNYISAKEYQQASEDNVYAKIKSHTAKGNKNSVYSYFTDALITQIVADLQEQKGYTQSQAYQLVYRGGLKIYSTQNTKLQKIALAVQCRPQLIGTCSVLRLKLRNRCFRTCLYRRMPTTPSSGSDLYGYLPDKRNGRYSLAVLPVGSISPCNSLFLSENIGCTGFILGGTRCSI